jgi:ribosomal protein L40E
MTRVTPRSWLFVSVVILAAIYASSPVASAQTTRTNTLTQVTNISLTNTILSTITTSVVVYTTTTQTTNSTIEGTQTLMQLSITTVTSTYTMITSGTSTETVSAIITQVSTETTQLLGNIWGESLALILFVSAVASYIHPSLRSRRPRGAVCSRCSNRNPPFAKAFCVKCGQRLNNK